MNPLITLKSFIIENKVFLLVGLVSILGFIFIANFMISMPRTFFATVGLVVGFLFRHLFWKPTKKSKRPRKEKRNPTTGVITNDFDEEVHLGI